MANAPDQVRGELAYRTDGQRPRFTRRRVIIGALILIAGWLAVSIFHTFFGTWIRFYGQVVDENGQPVPNALVNYTVQRKNGKLVFELPAPYPVESRSSTTQHQYSLVTDASGKFSINALGDVLGIDKVEATDHIPTSNTGGFDYRSDQLSPPFSPDRSHPVVFVLQNLPLGMFYGKVVDEQRQPVAGAKVTLVIRGRYTEVKRVAVQTDANGTFSISCRGFVINLANIEKAGFAPYGGSQTYELAISGASTRPYVSSLEHPEVFVLRRPSGFTSH